MMNKKEKMGEYTEHLGDEAINRGTTGQSLKDKGMHYDPATGKPTGGEDMGYEGEGMSHGGKDDSYE
ncbi:MAG: hypothetical protein ACC707_14695 [Thiohalomonadales bacterium]